MPSWQRVQRRVNSQLAIPEKAVEMKAQKKDLQTEQTATSGKTRKEK
jgi:hypothetical protein